MAKITLPDYAGNGPAPAPEAATQSGITLNSSAAYEAQQQQDLSINKDAGDIQDMVDKTTVNDLYANTYAPAARDIEMQYRALQGKDAVEQFPLYQQKVMDLNNQMKNQLTGHQADLFNPLSTAHTERVLDTMGSAYDQQNKVFQKTTSDSMLDNFVTDAADHYNDQNYFNQNVYSGFKEIDGYGDKTGQSTDEMTQRKVAFASKIISARYTAQAQFDPEGALDGFRSDMQHVHDPLVAAQTSQQLQSAVQPGRGNATAANVMQGGSMTDFDKLTDAVIQQESGGRSAALNMSSNNGQPSVGLMQLQPDIARQVAGELGVPFDPQKLQNDPEYNKVLGQKYLTDMVNRYSGNQTLALAAYNAGPANVDKWVKQFGDPRQGVISDQDFINKIPFSETQKYVSSINAKAPPLPGVPPVAGGDIAYNQQNWQTQISNMPDGGTKNMASATVNAAVNKIQLDSSTADMTNRNTLLSGLTGNKISSPEDIQKDPNFQAAWIAAAPTTQSHILSAISEGNKTQTDTPEGFRTYNTLLGQSASDPSGFQKVDLNAYYGKVPTQKLDQLANIQKSIMSEQTKATEQTVPYARLKELADPMARTQLGIDPDAKNGTPDNKLWNNFVGRLSSNVEDFKNQQKKVPTDQDIQKMAAQLMVPVSQDKSSMFGMWNSTSKTPAFEIQPQDIPDAEKAQIIPALTSAFGRTPTDQEMLKAYLKKKTGQ